MMKNNNNFNKNVKSVDTNDNNNNGDDFMKILNKKQFKALKKGEAYTEYLSVGELADAFKYKADKAEALLKDAKNECIEAQKEASHAQKEASHAQKEASQAQKEASQAQKEASQAQKEASQAQKLAQESEARAQESEARAQESEARAQESEARAEAAELRAVAAEGKADAGLDLVTELQNDLDDLVENRDEAFARYNRLGARMTGKKNRANINTGTIRHYNNIIRDCKKEIEKGIDVEGNKATINELEAEIRNLQRQVEAANGTFHEMKYNKTIVSHKIDAMDDELNKRYKLNNLLGELGYI